MRLVTSLAGALALAALTFSPVSGAPAQKETETVDRTVQLPDNGTVRLRNFSGAIRITGSPGRDVVIHAVRTAERRQLDHIELAIETNGTTVAIDANRRDPGWEDEKDNVVSTRFEIQVPADARLDVEAFSSDLDIRGLSGGQKLKTFSGEIVVSDAASAIEAESFSGRIEIDASGEERVPDIEAQTFSGAIRARLSDRASGSVRFDSFSGRLDSDVPLTVRSQGRRATSGDLPGGASGGELRLHTFSGDVRLLGR